VGQKCIIVTEEDYKQAMVLSRIILEGKFELKGDAIPLAYKAQAWFANHIQAMRAPLEYPPLQKAEEPKPQAEEVKDKPKKVRRKT
jgi:hypothetical protein